MSFTNYTALLAAIGTTINRTDVETPAADWVLMCEAEINRRLRVRQMVGRDTATIEDEYVSVPSDFAGPIAFNLQTSPITPLQYVSPDEADDWRSGKDTAVGKPRRYTIVGDAFRFSPAPDGEYTAYLTYWQSVPALVTNTTNWLLSAHPDVYLYGSLWHAGKWLKDRDLETSSFATFAQILADIQAEDAMSNTGQAPRMRVRSFG